jgi:hypothetical protein
MFGVWSVLFLLNPYLCLQSFEDVLLSGFRKTPASLSSHLFLMFYLNIKSFFLMQLKIPSEFIIIKYPVDICPQHLPYFVVAP